jgi:hypothetical protein
MTPLETLLAVLKMQGIEVLSVQDDHILLENDYEIEVEANGMYKLMNEGYVISPFSDVHAMCRFLLR